MLRLAPIIGPLAGLLGLALAGCHFTPPTPTAYVSLGPAHGQPLNPIAALPVRCGSFTEGCFPGYEAAVASATRMAIELGGGTLVDSELLNAEMRLRVTRTVTSKGGSPPPPTQPNPYAPPPSDPSTTTTEVTGATWTSLPPNEQRTFLEQIGVRSVLSTTLLLSSPQGLSGQRTVTVRLALMRLADDAISWQSECGVETGDYNSEPQAIELATQCALEGATLW